MFEVVASWGSKNSLNITETYSLRVDREEKERIDKENTKAVDTAVCKMLERNYGFRRGDTWASVFNNVYQSSQGDAQERGFVTHDAELSAKVADVLRKIKTVKVKVLNNSKHVMT